MTPFLRRCLAGILLALLISRLAGAGAAPTVFPGQNEKWRYYQSPNFELYSGNSDGESRDLLFKLEVLRAHLKERLRLKERRAVPVTIYYFAKDKNFRAYWPAIYQAKGNYSGFHVGRLDRASIMMAPREDEEQAQKVVFHEFVHHLINVADLNPPAWYNEGIAELFAPIRVEKDHIEIGHPPAGRVYELQQGRLLPLEQLFATTHGSSVFTEGKHTGMFYAQSWGLLHLCYFGRSDIPREKLDLFLRAACLPQYADPDKARALCQELLGMDYEQLSKALSEYIRSGRYGYARLPLPVVPDRKTYPTRPVSPEEIAARLAELEARVNNTGRAKLTLVQEAERNPTDPRPHEVLGTLARQESDNDRAREQWAKAIELGSENPAVFHELGQMESRRWFSQFDLYFRLPDEVAARLRDFLHRSIKAAPQQNAAYEMLAWVEATANEQDVANINLVQQHVGELTDKRRTLLATALTMWRRQDNENALAILDNLGRLEPDPWVKWGAETLRAKIEDRRPVRPASTGTKKPAIRVKVQKPKPGTAKKAE